jgi:hypothetical protein
MEEAVSYVAGRAGVKRGAGVTAGLTTWPRLRTFRLGMTTSETLDAVVKVLAPHIGDTMARSATEAHCQKLGITGSSPLRPDQLETLLGKLGGGLNIFLGREKSAAVIDEVRQAVTALEAAR